MTKFKPLAELEIGVAPDDDGPWIADEILHGVQAPFSFTGETGRAAARNACKALIDKDGVTNATTMWWTEQDAPTTVGAFLAEGYA